MATSFIQPSAQLAAIEAPDKTCFASDTTLKAHAQKEIIARSALVKAQKPEISASAPTDDEELAKLAAFAFAEAEDISSLLGYRVSNIDVLLLFFEILKLSIEERKNQKLSRQLERECMIELMHDIVKNYKEKGSAMLHSSLMSAGLGFAAAATPVVGHLWGKPIRDFFGSLAGSVSFLSFLERVKQMDPKELTKMAGKMLHQSSKFSEHTGTIGGNYSDADRTYFETYKQLNEAWSQERTRSIEESLQDWNSLVNFLTQHLQREHDTANSNYR